MIPSRSRIDVRLLNQEPKEKNSSGFSALFLSVVAGIFTLAGTLLGAYLQGIQNLQLEREKAQNEIIIKVIETGDTESAKKNLLFLIAAGLVKDPDRKIAEAATNPETSPVLPSVALPTLDLGYRVPKLPRKISEVIISDTQTPNFASTLAGLSNVKVSYHYLIEESGTTHRLVDEALVAFHTSGHNDNSIGIGLIHSRGQPYPEAQIDALNILLADVVKRNAISLDKILPKSAVDSRKTTDVAPKIDEIRKIIEAKNDGVTGRGDR